MTDLGPCGGTNSYCRYCGLQHATADHVHIPGPLKPSFFECCGARVERNACGAIGRGQHAPECPKQNAAAAPLSAPTCPACNEGWPIRSRDGKPIHIIDDSEYPRSLECSAKTEKAEVASSPQIEQVTPFMDVAWDKASSPSPTEPFFATDADFRNAVDILYEDWRARPSHEATTDFDEWKVAEIMRLRAVKVTPELSYDDLCRLAQVFMGNCELRCHVMPHGPMDARIHDWLSEKLTNARPLPSPPKENLDEYTR